MNADQRKKIMDAQLQLSKFSTLLEEIRDENQDSYDNLPEGLQQAEKGQDMQQAIDWLDEAVNALEECDSALSNF